MDCSTPGLPVLQYLPKFAQTHVYWVNDAIQPSHPVVPISSCLQSLPASGSFPVSQFFASSGQSIRVSASILPVNIQSWFPLGLTGLISLLFQEFSRVFSSTIVWKHQVLRCSDFFIVQFSQPSVQFSSVAHSCLILCDPMDHSTPGFPVHRQFPELTQIHVHWVGDAIQPSHPLSSSSLPAFNLFQHQGLFQWISPSHQVAKVLEFQLQHQSFQWIFRTDLL